MSTGERQTYRDANDMPTERAVLAREWAAMRLALSRPRDNNAYTSRGFKTLWGRVVRAAIAEKIITQATRFTFHDLRAFYTTEHKRITGSLPDMHKNPETTARVYDRNKIVKRASN